jgi:sterol desaturase/sphingolipid hydroxylase (fatty acid hydroxylase superfamily)
MIQGGVINAYLYHLSDILFYGKPLDIEKWKKTQFYELVIYNGDSTYMYTLGGMAYMSLKTFPECIRWTLEFPGMTPVLLQLFLLFIMHDFFFYGIHYYVHKLPKYRVLHLKWHHECPFDVGSSRCALATEGYEGLLRDLYSATIPTYIISFCGYPFYGYIWIFYYSIYSFWAMYVHTGVNVYHNLHHSINSSRNYGLYYISDYVFGTLDCREKQNIS